VSAALHDAAAHLSALADALAEARRDHDAMLAEVAALTAENETLRVAVAALEGAPQDGTFGAHLRGLREATGVSQLVVSERAGITTSGYWRIEAGQRRPARSVLARIAVALRLRRAEAVDLFARAGYDLVAGHLEAAS
jgi:DNA-binding XRE family transcriptional regulator